MAQDIVELRAFMAERIKEGFEPVHEIVENAGEYAYERFGREDLIPEIKRITAELVAAQQAEQAGWGPTTDSDRLDAAFFSLNRQGIVARQDFSCCNSCGFTEIWDEIEEEEKRQTVEGYVFFHSQFVERAIKTGQLLMAFGCTEDDPLAFYRVGEKIVAELRSVGLDASWRETEWDPITIDGIVWRRRR